MNPVMERVETWAQVEPLMGEPVTKPGSRSVTTEFILDTREVIEDGEPATRERVVTVTTSHFGRAEYVGRPDRVYIARLDYHLRVKTARSTTAQFGLYSQKTACLVNVPAPRYSAKALREVHADALARLAANYDRYENLRAVFTDAMEQNQ